jgi:type I restriction enzyme S subunit
MAKAKQQNKSIDELMEEALILYEKTPYKVPDNWCWVRLGSVFTMQNGYAFKSNEYSPIGIPIIKIGNLQNNEVIIDENTVFYEKKISKDFEIYDGDLLIALSGATTGKFGIFKQSKQAYLNQRVGKINITNKNYLIDKYRNYFFENIEEDILKSAYGGAQPNISWNEIAGFIFPLAPLDEQKRIVERIESLFAKLDEARDLIQKSLEAFADRKSAIFHKAFSGELTANWRRFNNKNIKIRHLPFEEIAEIKCNLVNPKDYPDYPHIAPDNIEKFTGKLLNYQSVAEDGMISGKHLFFRGQILYSKIRPNLSKVIISDINGLCSADMYPIEARENTRYLWYYMLSTDFLEQASNAGSRSVLPKINQKELSQINISIPEISEQAEIVRILDNFFEKEDKSQELMDMFDRIDEMKKVILARAFRGELGTNNPTDGPAKELLKKILEGRANEN